MAYYLTQTIHTRKKLREHIDIKFNFSSLRSKVSRPLIFVLEEKRSLLKICIGEKMAISLTIKNNLPLIKYRPISKASPKCFLETYTMIKNTN